MGIVGVGGAGVTHRKRVGDHRGGEDRGVDGVCTDAVCSILWPSNAMTSSGEHASAGTEGSRRLHREVTGRFSLEGFPDSRHTYAMAFTKSDTAAFVWQ